MAAPQVNHSIHSLLLDSGCRACISRVKGPFHFCPHPSPAWPLPAIHHWSWCLGHGSRRGALPTLQQWPEVSSLGLFSHVCFLNLYLLVLERWMFWHWRPHLAMDNFLIALLCVCAMTSVIWDTFPIHYMWTIASFLLKRGTCAKKLIDLKTKTASEFLVCSLLQFLSFIATSEHQCVWQWGKIGGHIKHYMHK